MDCQTNSMLEMTKEFGSFTTINLKNIDKNMEEQSLRLDKVYLNLLQLASKQVPTKVEPDKKATKRQSKVKNSQVGDLFAADFGFQQPIAPPPRRTRRLASMVGDKTITIRESTNISSGSTTRSSRARALSTFSDIASLDLPKANSTFVVDKKFMENMDECISPQMFPSENETTKKKPRNNETCIIMPPKNVANNLDINVQEESPVNAKSNSSGKKIGSKRKSDDNPVKNKRQQLEDINVNITEHSLLMTRTMKKKFQEENQIEHKKLNVAPLEHLVTPVKPPEDVVPIHQQRENDAEKRKEFFLKIKADNRKFDEQHLKVTRQREEQMKRDEEKIRKAAEEKKKKADKQKEKELLLKDEALKKQKVVELKFAEINAKRKQAEEAKLLKLRKIEKERKLKEAETKKKLKQEKSKLVAPSKVVTSYTPTLVSKVATTQNTKIEKPETNSNDYGLNDVSACDSSDDESGPKKPVPQWALKKNRDIAIEIQSGVDAVERDLFFACPTKIVLKEMFKGLNIRDKVRTSSAVWTTPPRYSEYIRKKC